MGIIQKSNKYSIVTNTVTNRAMNWIHTHTSLWWNLGGPLKSQETWDFSNILPCCLPHKNVDKCVVLSYGATLRIYIVIRKYLRFRRPKIGDINCWQVSHEMQILIFKNGKPIGSQFRQIPFYHLTWWFMCIVHTIYVPIDMHIRWVEMCHARDYY